ncbi:hypothetical protein N2152v2_010608 [Parachlorella kessleri]
MQTRWLKHKRGSVIPNSISTERLTEEPRTASPLEPAGEAAKFSWAKHWYAVGAVHNLDPTRPHPFSLLGKSLVIWRDSSTGRWNCLEDRCPHRAAPLSEGKIWPDGNLCCSYHGWRFDGSGACKAIPQADSAEQEARAAASPRACAVAYPVQERQGMLFVWGEGGQAASEEARQQEPPLCTLTQEAEAQNQRMTQVLPHYTRDLPYDYAALVENLVDPAHVPWSHHGVMGNRDKVVYGKSGLRKSGELSVNHDNFAEFLKRTVISFHPPGLVTYETERKKGGRSTMMFWVTPLAPGCSRITMHLATNASLPPLFKLLALRPAWLDHITTRSAVFDGDNVFLAGQDANLAQQAQQEGASWREVFYVPTPADTLVAAVRKWLDEKGGGGPFGSLRHKGSPAALAASAALLAQPSSESRRQMLDRYSQHTVHCASCRSALQRVTVLRNILSGAAVLSWAALLSPLLWGVSAWLGSSPAAAAVALKPSVRWHATTRVITNFITERNTKDAQTAPGPKPAGETAKFSWAKQWYGVGAAHDLEPTRPHALTLLGKKLVIWRDSSTGRWSCLEDRCPHRAAPLSEGKIWSDGNLSCSYHGWRFDGSGSCKAIPQADSAEQEARAAASPRACGVAYPIQERQGMLFVWGEGGQAALEEAMQQEPPLCKLTQETEAQGKEVKELMKHYTRDLPYDYAALVENLLDPAHVPWAHHGVVGNRDDVKYGQFRMHKVGELAASYPSYSGFLKQTTIICNPPSMLAYEMEGKGGDKSAMTFWMMPVAPGRSRVTMHMSTADKLPLIFKLLTLRPAWLDHITGRSALFDGDNVFLAGQDANLAQQAQQEGASWRDLFYMPTAADTLVAALRKWLDEKGGGGPFGSLRDSSSPAAAAASASLFAQPGNDSRRHMLDRYSQHTVHCKACRSALQRITLLRNILAGAAVLALATWLSPLLYTLSTRVGPQAAAATMASSRPSLVVAPVLLAAALTSAAALLSKLRDKFIFEDYIHAHK